MWRRKACKLLEDRSLTRISDLWTANSTHLARLPKRHDRQPNKKDSTTRRGSGEGSHAQDFPDWTIFMSLFNDVDLNRASNKQMCINNAQQVVADQTVSSQVIGSSDPSSPGTTKRRHSRKAIAEKMTDIFAQWLRKI